jgi:hypothetical protein
MVVFIIEPLLEGGVLQKVITLIAVVVIMVEVKSISNLLPKGLHKLKSCLTLVSQHI